MSTDNSGAPVAEGDEYSTHVREFRHLLLSKQDTTNKHEGARVYLKRIFKEIDENGDGTVSDSELFAFMQSLGVPEHVAEVLVQQIDINHDSKVTYSELAEFLWPRVESKREIGLVIEVVREALIASTGKKIISRALKNNTEKDDNALLQAFAEKTNAVLVRGRLIDVRQLKRALHNLMSTSLGALSDYEIEMLAHSMDANNDSVVSSREFKSWLFLQKGYFRSDSKVSDTSAAAPDGPGSESFTYDDVYPDPEEEAAAVAARDAEEARLAAERRREAEIERAVAERKRAEDDRVAAEKKKAEFDRIAADKRKAEADRAAAQQRAEQQAAQQRAEQQAAQQRAEQQAAQQRAEEEEAARKRAEAKRAAAESKVREEQVALEKKKALESRIAATRPAAEREDAEASKPAADTTSEHTPLLQMDTGTVEEADGRENDSSLRAPCVMFAGAVLCAAVTFSVVHAVFREFR